MAKKGNLSISKIKKVSKQIFETEVHVIDEGHYEDEKIEFQPLFDDVKIEELIVEFGNLLNEAEEKGIEISQQLEVNLVQILIVKYFTHFKNDISNSLLSEGKTIGVLDVLEHFQVTGLLGECIDNMFLPEEVRKVFSKITDFSAKGLFALDLNDEAIKKFSELKLKNQDVFDKLKKI